MTQTYPSMICICAASQEQELRFSELIEQRVGNTLFPREADFVVTHDPPDGRVGSGGGTLNALRQLEEQLGPSIHDNSILLIHAGGESRRLPIYAPEGKIFMPLPVPSSSAIPPTLLDLQLSFYMRYPWQPGELVVASGDVLIDFDTSLIPEDRGDICGFATSASLEMGSRHGVYRFARNRRNVTGFFQKASVDFLSREAALDGGDRCAVDMGTISFSRRGRELLRELSNVPNEGATLLDRIRSGSAAFDLYLELLSAALPGIDHSEYLDLVSGTSRLPRTDLEAFHDVLQHTDLTAVLASGTRFHHFGSLSDWQESAVELYRSPIPPFYYPELESPELHPDPPEITDTIWDRRRLSPAEVTAVYGVNDTWKPVPRLSDLTYCNQPMATWLEARGLAEEHVWPDRDPNAPYDIYEAQLYSPAFSDEFLARFLDAPDEPDPEWASQFRHAERMTLREINEQTDPVSREDALRSRRKAQLRRQILSGTGWTSISEPEFARIFSAADVPTLEQIVEATDDDLLRVYRDRLLGALRPDREREGTFAVNYLSHLTEPPNLRISVKEDQIVWARCPVRLDLAGGWTDTPPYTLREGGAVTNVAVDLNGQPPIQVFCRPIPEHVVRVHSIDLGIAEEYSSFEELESYGDPDANFALPKAALVLLGFTHSVIPGTLTQALSRLGGGLELTLLSAVPKGSGLGTSSVIGATILAALERFFGIYDEAFLHSGELYRQVLQMEQMLTTGGGWQDQIGGAAGGVKFIESRPGLRPDPHVYQLDPFLFEDPASLSQMTLFYTGATRLAKNILQEVVDGFNGMTPAYLFTVRRIGALAHEARRAIATRDLDTLAAVIGESWRENKLIHHSTTNDEIEALLEEVRPYYQAVKLLGAGGGGYALFISARSGDAARLCAQLIQYAENTSNKRARLVDFCLNKEGLQVTAS